MDPYGPMKMFGLDPDKLVELNQKLSFLDKKVLCVRCLQQYNLLHDAIQVKTKGLREKESACPNCECKIYYS